MQQIPPPVNLLVSTGEPAGIGPEISVAAAHAFIKEQANVAITLLGDEGLLRGTQSAYAHSERIKLQNIPLNEKVTAGVLNQNNAPYVLNLLNQAIDGCLQGQFDAMITAPIQKSVINLAGVPFTGHTEYLAECCGVAQVVMMLCASLPQGFLGLQRKQDLRVALVTTHLPLQSVPKVLSTQLILETIQIVHRDLRDKFSIARPCIRIAGLNPHAGESGYLGSEEIDIIIPAIQSAQKLGIEISGPYPADTMFDPASLESVDAFIAMYHDQGLAPFKFVTFGSGVNVTLGLPIIRTSVDHGTALDIAGHGKADCGSMLEALRLAYELARNQKEKH